MFHLAGFGFLALFSLLGFLGDDRRRPSDSYEYFGSGARWIR
ncbi:MAG: hypothetical protein HW391_1392 [Chloroflexi bacterium]|nr:hypothetical protein [Chloroflexota bacterium]